MNPESKTIREFSLTTKTKTGKDITVHFGYDASAYFGGFFVSASIDGSKPKSDSHTMRTVRSLGIPAINAIIRLIGCDITGAPYDLDKSSVVLFQKFTNHQITIDAVLEYYRLGAESEDIIMDVARTFYAVAYTTKAQRVLAKFNRDQRIRMITESRDAIRAVRELTVKGHVGASQVSVEGLLRLTRNRFYYKRDVDYVRKALCRLYRDVLKRKYRPIV